MDEMLTLSLTELTGRLRARKVSPDELMESVLDRVDETHGDLNAFVAMRDRESLLADARRCEERIQRGDARPLEGIPLGVKDLEHAEGLPNTEGSLIYKDRLSDHDDTHVARLKAAGAIVIGKTNAPEFGHTAVTKNLRLRSTLLDLDGTGDIDLDGSLDLSLLATFSPELSEALIGKVAQLEYRKGKDGRVTIPLRVAGNATEPRVEIDLDRILREGIQDRIKKRGKGLLRDLFGKKDE